jgi:hypothetical protein
LVARRWLRSIRVSISSSLALADLRSFFAYGLSRRVGQRLDRRARRVFDTLRERVIDEGSLDVCGYCGVVFKRSRRDQKYCSKRCKDARPTRMPAEGWWLVRLDPETEETKKRVQFGDQCLECGTSYWANGYSKGCCKACGSAVARKRRYDRGRETPRPRRLPLDEPLAHHGYPLALANWRIGRVAQSVAHKGIERTQAAPLSTPETLT